MKQLTFNISEINSDLFTKAYAAFINTYEHVPTTAYLNRDTLKVLHNRNSDVSIIYELDDTMSFGEVAFG